MAHQNESVGNVGTPAKALLKLLLWLKPDSGLPTGTLARRLISASREFLEELAYLDLWCDRYEAKLEPFASTCVEFAIDTVINFDGEIVVISQELPCSALATPH